jgi:hypothetical protein
MTNDLDSVPDREVWDLVLVEHEGRRVVLDLVGNHRVGTDRLLTISFEVEDDEERRELVETTSRWRARSEALELEAMRMGDLTVIMLMAGDDGLTLTAVE